MPNIEQTEIIFDASPLRYLHTGLGQFSIQLLRQFGKSAAGDLRFYALVHPEYQSLVPAGISVDKASYLRRHGPAIVQRILARPCDVWHMTTENTRLTGVPFSAKVILTLHGLHFLDEGDGAFISKHLKKVQKLVDRADAITAVSQFTADLARKNLNLRGKSIQVIHNGIAFSEGRASRPAWAPAGKFVFSIGTFFERKNFHTLLPMMERLPDLKLVLAGDPHRSYGDIVRAEIRRLGLFDRVVIPGEIPEEEKNWLYREGEALVFPSISEGFGIPVIEAFHHGKPVFCGRYGSLPEVGSEYAFYWEDFEPVKMANLVASKLEHENERQRSLRKEYAGRYAWDQAAKSFLALYRSVLKGKTLS